MTDGMSEPPNELRALGRLNCNRERGLVVGRDIDWMCVGAREGNAAYLYDSNLAFDREFNVGVLRGRHGVSSV
jgi:hypothetical protein